MAGTRIRLIKKIKMNGGVTMPQNIFKIYDGRTSFWQWDINQKLIVLDQSITEVHFSNKDVNYSVVEQVYKKEGLRLCNVPDVLLQIPKNLIVYAYTDGKTVKSVRFAVTKRNIPGGHVIAEKPNDVAKINQRLERLESMVDGSGGGAAASKLITITISANGWQGSNNLYSQVVECNDVSANSKLDLQPTPTQIAELQDAEISLMATNNNGIVTIYAIGNKPTVDYTMDVLITEVVVV